jgi:Nif-specific regulatory protein
MAARTLKGYANLLKRRTIEMTTLYEISKVLGSSMNTRVTINSALRVLVNFLGLKKASILEYDHDSKLLKIVYAYGYTRDEVKNSVYKTDNGVVGRSIKTGVPEVVLENPTKIAIQLKIQNRAYGVFYIEREFTDEITINEELKFFNVVASMFSQSIHLSKEAEKTRNKLLQENVVLKEQLEKKAGLHGIIGISNQMEEVFRLVTRVAPTDTTVLLRGESGTGKELIANAIHSLSNRRGQPFIKVNCPAIPETLLESELFGHEKGAFTGATESRKGRFELANGGTIFLDEIGELSIHIQSKLLRFLQENSFERVGSSKTIRVNVRVIAATNRNLEKMIGEGLFRSDLYYRLNIVPIILPPLRDRKEDIPLLVENFLDTFNKINNKSVKLTERALRVLMEYPWPGNVRELENCIQRVVVLANSNIIDQEDLPLPVVYPEINVSPQQSEIATVRSYTLNDVERDTIIKALKESNWKQKDAASKLGITVRQLNYKLKKYNIVKTYKIV